MEHYPNRSSAGLLMGGHSALVTKEPVHDHLPSHPKTKIELQTAVLLWAHQCGMMDVLDVLE